MGKALVINGLQVTNPLTTVTIGDSPTEIALRKYLLANSTINSTEEDALTTLVDSLMSGDVWDKVKYLYPLIGNQISDIILDVIDPATEDILSNSGTTGLSVSNRCLIANGRTVVYSNTGTRAKKLDPTKLGFILAGKAPEYSGSSTIGQGFQFRKSYNFGLNVCTGSSGYAYPELRCNGTDIKDASNSQSYVNRIILGNVGNGTGSLYWENVLKASNNVDLSTFDITTAQMYGVLYNLASTNYQYNFAAVTEGMTNDEWVNVVYPAILAFLQSVGRRA